MEDFNSKYTGPEVENLLDQVASGNAGGGGGGGITVKSDPIFSASPAASITEEKIAEWDAKSAQGEKGDKGDTGADGVGVQSVAQTTTSTADGGTNVVTVTLSNGTTSTFNVKNGSKGSNGTNGTNGKDGADGADGATFTPSVDSAGNLSWTNNKGLTNPPTVNIKGPKGDKGDAGEGGSSGGGGNKEIIEWWETNLYDAEPNKIYICDPFASLTITLAPTDALVDEWVFHIVNCFSLVLPDNVLWAGGEAPNMPESGSFGPEQMLEVSIVKTRITGYEDDIEFYKAVGVLFTKE